MSSVLVDKRGQRFVNEAMPYGDKLAAMDAKNRAAGETIPGFLVFGAEYRRNYPIGPLLPGRQQPDWLVPREIMQTFTKATTLRELGPRLDTDGEALAPTVARMNELPRTGRDLVNAPGRNPCHDR